MREIVLDTETTGLDPNQGDRLVEMGCVELINHTPTGKTYQCYYNPERKMSAGALAITSITDAFLKDKPLFADKVGAFLDFIGDAKLVIHNAPFDMKFINHELGVLGKPLLSFDRVVDTLVIARKKFAGVSNSLDALCRRFSVDNSNREKHGALLDSELLAEVYLELIGGRQPGLVFQASQLAQTNERAQAEAGAQAGTISKPRARRSKPLPSRLSSADYQAHVDFLEKIPTRAKWLNWFNAVEGTGMNEKNKT